jgi:hypothetical protein
MKGTIYRKCLDGANPKEVDQPDRNPSGTLTQNGLFADAVAGYKKGASPAERVRVYEKIRSGIWVYNGLFELVDCWTEQSGSRRVFKFKLQMINNEAPEAPLASAALARPPTSTLITSSPTRRGVPRKIPETFRSCVGGTTWLSGTESSSSKVFFSARRILSSQAGSNPFGKFSTLPYFSALTNPTSCTVIIQYAWL